MDRVNKSSNTIRLCICIEFFLAACIVVFGMFQLNNLVSLSFYGIFIIELIILIYCADSRIRMTKLNVSLLIIILFALINVSLNALIVPGSQIGFAYFKKYLMFISSILLFYLTIKVPVSKETINTIVFLCLLCIVIMALAYRFMPIRVYYFNGKFSQYLTFGMQNPNKTGLFLTAFFAYAAVFLYYTKRKTIKLICIFSIPMILYFILQSKARNALFAVILFSIFYCIAVIRKEMFIPKIALIVSIGFPLFFAILYILLINSSWAIRTLDFLVSEGKPLDSRSKEWIAFFYQYLDSFIIGAYSQISSGTGVSQCLNSAIDILASYGTIVYLGVSAFLYYLLKEICSLCTCKKQFISLIGFFAILFAGAGEAAVFSGGTGISVFAWGFLLLAKYQESEVPALGG